MPEQILTCPPNLERVADSSDFRQSRVFRAKRLMDLVMTMSIWPAIAFYNIIMRLKIVNKM